MRSWTPAVPIAAALATSAALFDRLPPTVRPALDALFPVAPMDIEPMPRAAVAVILPATAVLVWALLAAVARVRAPVPAMPAWLVSETTDANAVARFESTYHTLVFAIVSCLAVMHVALIGSATGWPLWTIRIGIAAVGIAMLTAGNVIPRSRPNWIVGIRTKRTLGSAAVWALTHRILGALLMIVGLLVIVSSIVVPTYALIVGFGGMLVALIAAHAFGASADERAGTEREVGARGDGPAAPPALK